MRLEDIPADNPSTTALLLDIDGTLAAICDDPAAVAVADTTLALLARARASCGLVGIVTGRTVEQARALLPTDGSWLAASHGVHLIAPDGTENIDETAHGVRHLLDDAVTLARTVGWRFEDKLHSVTMHFRHVATPELTAKQMRAQMSTVLDPRKLEIHDARMALEVRPAGARTKGDAVRHILATAPAGVQTAVFVGDDVTDIDAFAALDSGGHRAIRVAVSSEEAPPALLEAADVVLGSQAEVDLLLAHIAG